MKSVYDKATRDELISRIGSLSENSSPLWGKMTVYQMLKHCSQWEEMVLGRKKYKRSLMGRLFGRMALKNLLKDEKPVSRNMPTVPEFRITGEGDVAYEKRKWIGLIEEHAHYSNPEFIHPFFGKMTKAQIGLLAYKHADHHLRQFNS